MSEEVKADSGLGELPTKNSEGGLNSVGTEQAKQEEVPYDFKVETREGTFKFADIPNSQFEDIKRTVRGISKGGEVDEDLLQNKLIVAMSVEPKLTDIQMRKLKASTVIKMGLAIKKWMDLDDFL